MKQLFIQEYEQDRLIFISTKINWFFILFFFQLLQETWDSNYIEEGI